MRGCVMASKAPFFLVILLYLTTGRVPGRYELGNPDLEASRHAARVAVKRA